MRDIEMEKQKTDWVTGERKYRDVRQNEDAKDTLVKKRTEGMLRDIGIVETNDTTREVSDKNVIGNSWTEDEN